MNETTQQADEVLDREKTIETLNELIELDYDAVKTYEKAMSHVENIEVKDDLELFKLDHERHIADLGQVVLDMGGTPKSAGRDLKGVLLEGLTMLRSVTGTIGALRAMRMNERLTNRTYAKAADLPLPPLAHMVVDRNRSDERRHLIAITAHIERLSEEDERDEDLEDEEDHEEDSDRPIAPLV